MVKLLRKHKQWLMVGFGVLLMLAFLGGPAIEGTTKLVGNRTVGSLNGRRVRASDLHLASKELSALNQLAPFMIRGPFGIEDGRNTQHWLLLAEEAEQAGLVGEAGDGQEFLESILAPQVAQASLQQDIRFLISPPQEQRKIIDDTVQAVISAAPGIFATARMNEEEMDLALAKAHGVLRLVLAYNGAPRVSDRRAVAHARHALDAAVMDYAFLPASGLAPAMPAPDEAALAAHVEQFKGTKPGEGEHGIGYLLPPRVKLEWLTLDRDAIIQAVQLDPVEVHKRHSQNRARYPGTLDQERAKVEADMRAERADRIMGEAQLVIQAEVSKATRRLEREGKYRKLPADWAQNAPALPAIAEAVRDQVSKTMSVQLPLPAVTVKGEWLTRQDLAALPGLGRAMLRVGGSEAPLPEVVFWAKELGGSDNALAIQEGIPLAEHPLVDELGNRHYILIRQTRGESPPDGVEEVRERAVEDYKKLRAFESLRARADEFKAAAMSGGVDAAASAYAATPLPEGKTPAKPEVKRAARATRAYAEVTELNRDEDARKAVMEAAEKLDPKAPPDQHPPEQTTLVLPTPQSLGVAVLRIRALAPMTREAYVGVDKPAAVRVIQEELGEATKAADASAFKLEALLKRHEYIIGDKRITTLKEAEDEGS